MFCKTKDVCHLTSLAYIIIISSNPSQDDFVLKMHFLHQLMIQIIFQTDRSCHNLYNDKTVCRSTCLLQAMDHQYLTCLDHSGLITNMREAFILWDGVKVLLNTPN